MKWATFSIITLLGSLLIANDLIYAAHILEPLGTEIAATPPRGRMFGQIEYAYSKIDPDEGEEITSHTLPVEFEIGVGERTQLNLEAVVLLKEEEGSSEESENGIEEMAFGLKHRFLDESETLPDAAFLVEFAPAAGLKGDEAELKGTLLFTKNLTNRFLIHVETGYLHKTEREVEVEGIEGEVHVENANIFVYNIVPIIRVIPDRLLLMVELNGESNFRDDIDAITIAPEAIFAIQNMALKVAVPLGLTDESQDMGVRVGLSRLFQ
jgi:hypothetical protein